MENISDEKLAAGEALLNAAANVLNEARTKLAPDEDLDDIWRAIINKRERAHDEMVRRRRALPQNENSG